MREKSPPPSAKSLRAAGTVPAAEFKEPALAAFGGETGHLRRCKALVDWRGDEFLEGTVVDIADLEVWAYMEIAWVHRTVMLNDEVLPAALAE